MNNRADVLAKQGADLPEQEATHPGPWRVTVSAKEAPTPARKWLHHLRREHVTQGRLKDNGDTTECSGCGATFAVL